MSTKNLCGVLHGKDDLRLEERTFEEKPGKGEVLLSMQSVGICGSDISFFKKGRIGDFVLTKPLILGHEASAIVTAIGDGVTSLVPGDRVCLELGISCRMCQYCKSGRYNLCPEMVFLSCPPERDGCFTQYLVHPADLCFKLPDNISLDEGAVVEPLSVAVYACERAGVGLGSQVLICGAGAIGMLCTLAAKAFGASKIIVTDINSERLELVKKLGATHTVMVANKDPKTIAKQIHDLLQDQPNITMECSGAQSAIATGVYATRSGGVLTLIGLGSAEVTIPIVDASVREVDIVGVLRYCNTYPKTIDLLASGKINVRPLLTHFYRLEDIHTAFEMAKTGQDGALKVIVRCNAKDD